MKRGTAAFFLVWCVAWGAWCTKNFAQGHERTELVCALLQLAFAAFYAHQLWRKP